MNGIEIPKQRGIYSEILTTEDTENLQQVSTFGPSEKNLMKVNQTQAKPRALGIVRKPKDPKQIKAARKIVEEAEDPEDIVVGKEFYRDSKINEGHYSKKREGVADVDPKVMEPYEPIPGKPPRKVVIDRQRKLFASLDIEELLLELGIDYRAPEDKTVGWLKLEAFDDTEYDSRLPEEWISYGCQEDGTFCPIPGKGLKEITVMNPETQEQRKERVWIPVLISEYDSENEVFIGKWDDESMERVQLTRINLLFDAEDPRIFAQRVYQAHTERIYAESQIRYNFFVDFMPFDGLYELDTEQKTRILKKATACKTLKEKKEQIDPSEIMQEVTKEYKRTANKIIMDDISQTEEDKAAIRRHDNYGRGYEKIKEDEMIPTDLTLPPKPKNKPVPYFAQVPIPKHDFPEQFSTFCFNSLFIKEQVIDALVKIKQECNEVLEKNSIWTVNLNKSMRVEEFKQNQQAKNSNLKNQLGEMGWCDRLCKIIKVSFKGVGKGWFNLQVTEEEKESYEFGKLKKFLQLVNFMMQDTVLNLCKNSVYEFTNYMCDFIPDETIIISASEVKNTYRRLEEQPDDSEDSEWEIPIDDSDNAQVKAAKQFLNNLNGKKKEVEPLFLLDLILKGKQPIPAYSNQPEEIVQKIKDVFENGIKSLQDIPHLEPTLLKLLFKTSSKKSIKSPVVPHEKPKTPDPNDKKALADENTWLWEAFDRLGSEMERAIIPLEEYVKTYAAFEEQHKLEPDKYVQSLEEGDKENPDKGVSPQWLKDDIYRMKEKEQKLFDMIPQQIAVSMFMINCKEIRQFYAQKYQQIVEKEIKLIGRIAKDRTTTLSATFDAMQNKIMKKPETINELSEIKNLIKDGGSEIEKLKKDIDECMEYYEILEEFNYKLSNAEYNQKWDLYGAPKRIVKVMETQSAALDKLKEIMIKEMEAEQEEFEEAITSLELIVQGFDSNNTLEKYKEVAAEVENIDLEIKRCFDKQKMFNEREQLVNKPITDYSKLQRIAKDFTPYSNLWKTARTWFEKHEHWMTCEWEDLDAPDLEQIFENCQKTINQVYRQFRDKDKTEMLKMAEKIKAQVDEFKPIVPLAVALRKDGMKDRHWDAISEKVGFDIRPVEGFTLTKVVDAGMLKFVDVAEEQGEKAFKEFHIEKTLAKMKKDWSTLKFLTPKWKNTPTCTIAGFDEANNLFDEHIVQTQAFQFSVFKKPFEQEIEEWSAKLLLGMETLEQWVICMAQWCYLQPIFDSADIMKQLPTETKRFKGVDIKWRYIMNQCRENPLILDNCSKEGLKEAFIEANKSLELVQKGLSEYLERKRSSFARFYFLSDDELLEILSQTKEVQKVRSHLRKVFEAIADLEFKQGDTMTAMMSIEGEKINFVKKVDPVGKNVEQWMGDVEKQMVTSVRHVFEEGLLDYSDEGRNDWIIKHPGQVVLNASQVKWTNDVESAFKNEAYEGICKYFNFLKEQLNRTVMLVRQDLPKLAKISLNALIVIDVHARDVIGRLVDEKVSESSAFEWVQQLRYYWEMDDQEVENCICKCVATVFPYGYEYLGNTGRLVITELTDKCYITLMGALQLNLGGAPAGPAGTGKTESTKDLAKALAKQCVVFNCSGDMTHTMVATFFKGLAASGAWCCFDEFNRINIEVLSVIAQYLLTLFGAKARNDPEVTFEGSLIKMKPTFCVFITMNPGYAGRVELPDNLQALFRPVAMMVPDYAMIGEIMLYSFGFLRGQILAKKMVSTFQLASEQLSSQKHYDYGMRAVRSVINAAGRLKSELPDMDEDQTLLRAIRDVNVPKFLAPDLPLFENIIKDLFPGVEKPVQEYGGLINSIENQCQKNNIQNVENFNIKVIQLYDTILVRHGLMIVGPTGGGKTKNYQILQKAISALNGEDDFVNVKVDVLNPKSVTMGQLFGFVDPGTLEWQDGVLAKLVLDASRDESPDRRWIMFDGPVDALWIENMNTVLDDNKKLCLNSGQIIQLTNRMTMMFEVEDLAVASPATVSRCGMVYMEPESIGLSPFVTSWLNTLPPKVADNKYIINTLQALFDDTLDELTYFVRKNCGELVKTVNNNLAMSSMRLIDCFMSKYIEDEVTRITPDQVENLSQMIKEIYFFCFIWSVGATTNVAGRQKFDLQIREKMQKHKIDFPEEGLVYDWNWNTENKTWESWFKTIPAYEVDIKTTFSDIVVPTLDSIRMKNICQRLIENGKHVLMPGPTGTGKSVYVQQLCTYEMTEEYQMLKICFSAQTSANQTQDFLDDKTVKRRHRVFGPELGKKYIIFVDDLNMPQKEEFGAQPPIELLRQFIDAGGWYDRNNKEKPFIKIVDFFLVSAMGPPGGGRSAITQRLQRHFNILTYTEMQHSAMKTIFTTILDAYFFNFNSEVKKAVETCVNAQLEVYDNVLNGPLKPIPSKSHYTFNLRDISKVFQGIVSVNKQNCSTIVHLIRGLIHENKRVFGDRLNDNPDRNYLDELLLEKAGSAFNITREQIYNAERIIFGDFMDGIELETRVYRQIDDLKQMQSIIEGYLDDYNGQTKVQMPLVMFLDACDHVSRIQRIIRQPLGNAFLLGVGGSGRQSLSRLASFIASYKLFQVEVIKGYSMTNWREDVKIALMQAGVDNKPTSFLFVDTQIINELMLEDINNILNGGDVPNLYRAEDMEPILKVGKQLCLEQGITVSKMNMMMAYLGRVCKNIHMIIAMSPLGTEFRTRIRQFPSLVTCSTIDWFNEWPEEALLGVGRGQILSTDVDLGNDLNNCVEMFKFIHQSVERKSQQFLDELNRHNYVTPTSFLEQLNMYTVILKEKKKKNYDDKFRLVNGLEVLKNAAIAIDKLKKEIDEMQPVLESTKKELTQVMAFLEQETESANQEKSIAAKVEAEASVQEAETSALQQEAEAELSKAIPLLEEANRVLKEIKKEDLYFIQSLKTPSANICLVMEFACHMFELKPTKKNLGKSQNDSGGYFDLSRGTLLNNVPQFLQKMIEYDKDHIPEKVVKKVNSMLDADTFSMNDILQASAALGGIMKWIKAMMSYHELLKIVNPKRQKVAEMNKELAVVRATLEEKRKLVREIEEKLAGLNATLTEKKDQEKKLIDQIENSNIKLGRAEKIITGLQSEKEKWEETVARLTKESELLIGNSLVAAGMVAYSGPFTAKYRVELEQEWSEEIARLGTKVQHNVCMKEILEDKVTTMTWTAAQLPSDNLSIENAIIMFKSRRWPLMIDPQNQANKFIKNLSKDKEGSCKNQFKSFKASDQTLMKALELSIQNGDWFLIENVGEELDPSWEAILQKQVDKSGTIRIGDKQIAYDQNFRFFMTTTMPNPHYSPENQVKVSLLNFAITPFGLEEQMLYTFVVQEMPELQKQKNKIVEDNARSARQLREIEEKILQGLTKNTEIAAILEDDELINILDSSKLVTDDINARMKESVVTEKEIDQTREKFRPVAFRAQILFFTIVDLAAIDPMYQYSLQWFSQLFCSSVDNSGGKNSDAQTRIMELNNHFTKSLYDNICRSLFEKHKLLFSFKMTVNILFGREQMDADELRFFLAGPQGDVQVPKNPTDWLDDLTWGDVGKQIFAMCSVVPALKGFDTYFMKNQKLFKKIFDSEKPEAEELPGEWEDKLTSFQKMIVLKSIRSDKITLAVQRFITEHIGEEYISPPVFDLKQSFKDSSITTPLVFILSPGSDPVESFQKFAETMNMAKKSQSTSLGRGQGEKAEQMINENLNRGGWVLLMNCHLAASWMPRLEAICEQIDDTKHRDFRLWLTSNPTPSFPIPILQNSVKMTLEPPSGLKNNILQTYSSFSDEDFENCTKPVAYKKLLFGFCFFHAIVQDRRKFGPIGWNKPYAFTNEDLKVSRTQLKIFVEDYQEVPYKVLNYIGADINYGGRVTEAQDKRLISTILKHYMNPNILIDNHPFSTSGIYKSIPAGERDDYIDYINELPLNPEPEAFGLHANAQITTAQIDTTDLLTNMIAMQPRAQSGKGKTREEIIGDMAMFLQKKTPEVFDLEKVEKKYPTSYTESMNTVIYQECVRYNALLAEMKVSLVEVQKALRGEVGMSEKLESMANAIFNNTVPNDWRQETGGKGYLSMQPLASWINDCNARIKFLSDWYDNGTPVCFWMSGFFFPQAFLTATMQNYARANTIAIDELSYSFQVRDELKVEDIKEKPEMGCLVYGLFLEGAGWNYTTHMLDDSEPKKLFVEMPMIAFIPVQHRPKAVGVYKSPTYKVLSRLGVLLTTGHSTNFVLDIELPTDRNPEDWTRAGVATFLALKY